MHEGYLTIEPKTFREVLQLKIPQNPTITRSWLHVENPVAKVNEPTIYNVLHVFIFSNQKDVFNLPCHTSQCTSDFITQNGLDNMNSDEIDDFLIESQRYCEFSQERLKRIEELKIHLKKQTRRLNNVQSQNFLYKQDNQNPVENKIDKVHLRMYIHGPYTKELEIWFDKVVNSCLGLSDTDRYYGLQSIRHDPNVVFMATEFVNFIVNQTNYNAINPNIKNLTYIMKMLKNFLLNEVFSVNCIKEHLHVLIPACITCIVCSTLCRRLEIENLWKLRGNLMHLAVEILKVIVKKYSSPINKIEERVISVFKNAINDSELDLSSVYASLYTIQSMGTNPKTGLNYLDELDIQLYEIDKRVSSITCAPGLMDTHRYHAIKIKNLIFKYHQSKNPTYNHNMIVSGKGGKLMNKSSIYTNTNNNSAVQNINVHNYSSNVMNNNYNNNNGTGSYENEMKNHRVSAPLNLLQQQQQQKQR